MAYDSTKIAWQTLSSPIARATEALTRLDERLARSPVGEGWIQRLHFHDAAAALWLEGELIHLEDLVLHDAHMDLRAPTHELTRAHAVLRARRQIQGSKPGWALSQEGLSQLTRRASAATRDTVEPAARGDQDMRAEVSPEPTQALADDKNAADHGTGDADSEMAELDFADIDAVLDRTTRLLDGQTPASRAIRPSARDPLVYDLDWNEDERLAEWRDVLDQTGELPAVLRAALLLDAWQLIEVLQHAAWLGSLLVAELMREAGLSANHLACLAVGLRVIPRERRRAPDETARLQAYIEAAIQTAEIGLKEHDRLALARIQLERRLRDRRSSSRLPQLIELVLARPLVSTNMVQQQLKVSRQGALDLIGELGLREITGRKRFQAWAVS